MRPQEILEQARTIAVVGASSDPGRPSYEVVQYLTEQGFDVIPVRPDCDTILGLRCYPELSAVDRPVDIVDVFRRGEAAPEIAHQAVAAGAKALWLQEGVTSAEARAIAEDAGLAYVEDRCIKLVHEGVG